MPREGNRLTGSIIMLLMVGLSCAGLAILTRYTKVRLVQAQAEKKPQADQSAVPFAERIKLLSRQAYYTTQSGGTDNDDTPHTGRWVQHQEPGVYLDVVSDRVLFTSAAKLESSEGYAEFSAPAVPEEIEEVPRDGGVIRLRARTAGTWLGRAAPDRRQPEIKRYIINSSALNFVPAAELEARGLAEWKRLFPSGTPGEAAR